MVFLGTAPVWAEHRAGVRSLQREVRGVVKKHPGRPPFVTRLDF